MTGSQRHPGGRPHRSIHTCGWGAHVQDSQGAVSLPNTHKHLTPRSAHGVNDKGTQVSEGDHLDQKDRVVLYLGQGWLMVGQQLVNVPVVFKAPTVETRYHYMKTREKDDVGKCTEVMRVIPGPVFSPSSQFDGLVKTLLIHGLLHLLSLPTETDS